MVCSKCGQELKEGARFCTKCGVSFKETLNLSLPIISIILSITGIIGCWVFKLIRQNLYNTEYWEVANFYAPFESSFFVLIYIGLLIALFALNKEKSKIGFFAGLLPCAYLIIMQVYVVILFIGK